MSFNYRPQTDINLLNQHRMIWKMPYLTTINEIWSLQIKNNFSVSLMCPKCGTSSTSICECARQQHLIAITLNKINEHIETNGVNRYKPKFNDDELPNFLKSDGTSIEPFEGFPTFKPKLELPNNNINFFPKFK